MTGAFQHPFCCSSECYRDIEVSSFQRLDRFLDLSARPLSL
jgi:hypothetical protein